MSKYSIPQTSAQRQRAAFAATALRMAVSVTSNPRRYVGHPSGWRFVEGNADTGPLELAAALGYALSTARRLVEGPAAIRVLELLGEV